MKLNKLILHNFKGIREFTIDIGGNNASVFADNGYGKTSVMDAFLWIFTGKDSQGKQMEASIKTLTVSGEELHHLDHEAEAVIDIGGKVATLKKTFHEIWTKKRGSASESFSGHETLNEIDGVPKSKKEFDAFIAGIASEDMFKLLTNPAYFNEQLHWQKRREILLDVCGNISDSEVITSDKALTGLTKILNGRALEDHKKVVKAQMTKINKEKDEIPARIDEATRGLPDITGISPAEVLNIEIESLKKQQQAKQQELVRTENGGEVAEKQRKIREVEGRLLDLKNKHRAANEDKVFVKKREMQRLNLQLSGIDAEIKNTQQSISSNGIFIDRINADRVSLRSEFVEANKKVFEFTQDSNCPACGQPLPKERLLAVSEAAESQFKLANSQRIEEIDTQGRQLKAKAEDLIGVNDGLKTKLGNLIILKDKIIDSIAELQVEINSFDTDEPIESTPEYRSIDSLITKLQSEISDINLQKQSVIRKIQTEISLFNTDISARESNVMRLKMHEDGSKRITELEAKEKTLAAEYERLEGELDLCDKFTVAKVNLLESKINSKFKFARFKLFEQQINGGLNEICQTVYSGIPYGAGLNRGASMNVGLDVINTLSEHYGFTAPVFVDNAEAVTKLLSVQAQVIRLVVSEPDKTLRVEVE